MGKIEQAPESQKDSLADLFALISILIVIAVRLVSLGSFPPQWLTRCGGIAVIISTILSWILLKKDETPGGQYIATLVSIFVILYFIIMGF